VIVVLASEFGWKKVLAISAAEISIALTIGGIAFRVLSLVM
jgi:Fe2+ transport system protein B